MGNPVWAEWDTLLLAAAIGALLGMMLLGRDERLASPRRKTGAGRTFCEVDGGGCSDPDGKPWRAAMRPVRVQLIPIGGPGWAGDEARGPSGRTAVIQGYIIQ